MIDNPETNTPETKNPDTKNLENNNSGTNTPESNNPGELSPSAVSSERPTDASIESGPNFQLQVIPVTDLQQNCMLFWDSNSLNGVLIDPGGEVDKIIAEIEKRHLEIQAIWLTHGHVDHVGGAAECRRRLKCEILGPHSADQFLLDELKPGQYGIKEAESFSPDRYLIDGDQLSLEGVEFDILHCPGHSPGHIVIFQQTLSFAFVGDVLFNGSIGRTDLPGGSHQELITSITTKLWPLCEKTNNPIQFIPGHGPGSTFEQERKTNGFVADSILAP